MNLRRNSCGDNYWLVRFETQPSPPSSDTITSFFHRFSAGAEDYSRQGYHDSNIGSIMIRLPTAVVTRWFPHCEIHRARETSIHIVYLVYCNASVYYQRKYMHIHLCITSERMCTYICVLPTKVRAHRIESGGTWDRVLSLLLKYSGV